MIYLKNFCRNSSKTPKHAIGLFADDNDVPPFFAFFLLSKRCMLGGFRGIGDLWKGLDGYGEENSRSIGSEEASASHYS